MGRAAQREAPRCSDCNAPVCHVRMAGEGWVLCDWPPVVPVISFDLMIVATHGNYGELVDGELRDAAYTYDGFKVPGQVASILLQQHDCKAHVRYQGALTDEGRRALGALRRERETHHA